MAGQGLVGLGGAAGASEGFETLMARRLLEQRQMQAQQQFERQQAEAERAARSEETLRGRALDESAADKDLQRQLQLLSFQDLAATRKAAAEDRDLARGDMKSRTDEDRASREALTRQGQENQMAIAKLAAASRESTARPPRFQFLQTTGPDGQPQYALGDPYTGQVMPSTTGGPGANGEPAMPSSAPERLVQQTRDQIRPTIGRLRELSKQIHTNNDFSGRMKSGTAREFGSLTGTDPVAREYSRLRMPVSLSLAAIANQGRPTEPDRKAVEALLPGFTERADVASQLWDAVDRILANPHKFANIALIQSELTAAKAGNNPAPAGAGPGGVGGSTTVVWGRDASGRPVRVK